MQAHLIRHGFLLFLTASALWAAGSLWGQEAAALPADNIEVSGKLNRQRAELTIFADLLEGATATNRLLYTSRVTRTLKLESQSILDRRTVEFRRVQGAFERIRLGLADGDRPDRVTGDGLLSWSLQQTETTNRALLLEFTESETPRETVTVTIDTVTEPDDLPYRHELRNLQFEYPTLASGEILIAAAPELTFELTGESGLIGSSDGADELGDLPAPADRRFRFFATDYRAELAVAPSDPDALRVNLSELTVKGQLQDDLLHFEVTATAATQNPRGAQMPLLSGGAAIVGLRLPEQVSLRKTPGGYALHLARPGTYPVTFDFAARIVEQDGWFQTRFRLPAAALLPLQLEAFDEATEFRLVNGGSFAANQTGFLTYVPADGRVLLTWRSLQEAESSKLFYNTESHTVIRIGTGVMRQNSATVVTVMQGNLRELRFDVAGAGEITRVTATDILSWEVVPTDNPAVRELVVRFNQAQTETCQVDITTLSTLGSFPLETQPVKITPQGATRHHGLIEAYNEGAVRLNVVNTAGLSRISPGSRTDPNQNPQRQAYPSQHFAFRHSSTDYALTAQVDDIEPEISASALIAYHLGHDQTRIEADLDLEIREAPIREHVLTIPSDYVIAEVNAHRLADFFVGDAEEEGTATLRLEFEQPVFGRQQIRLRLEKNEALEGTLWNLGRIVSQATRQFRGHIGVSSIQGFRLIPETFSGVSEIATVYFPNQLEGLQAAFRITESEWNVSLNANPIPQAIQAECTHLYTIGNGLIYGSSLVQLAISGAPVDLLQFSIPEEYQNVEFTGKEVRNWISTDSGYDVVLQTPIIGFYTILVSYERPFQDEADMLDATGSFPLNTVSERGTIILSSNRQIQLDDGGEATTLIRLAPEELSSEHRLLLTQPILTAYQYHQRPFALNIGLSTLNEGSSVRQIVDRADIRTRIAQDGQTVTSASYFVKSTGSPHFRLLRPNQSQLWSASVNGEKVIPITADGASLIPLRAEADANQYHQVDIQLASSASEANPITIALPQLGVPVLYSNWRLEAAYGQRLRHLDGNVVPKQETRRSNGYRQLQQLMYGSGPWPAGALLKLTVAAAMLGLAAVVFLFSGQAQIHRFKWRHVIGLSVGALAGVSGVLILGSVSSGALNRPLPAAQNNLELELSLTLPEQPPEVTIENRSVDYVFNDYLGYGWPLALAAGLLLALAIYRWTPGQRTLAEFGVWLLIFLSVLSWPRGGAVALLLLLGFFLRYLLWPAFASAWRHRRKFVRETAVPALLLWGIGTFAAPAAAAAGFAVPNSVQQEVTIGEQHATGEVSLYWDAREREQLVLLRAPGILTGLSLDESRFRLSKTGSNVLTNTLMALQDGPALIRFTYQIPIDRNQKPDGFVLPTHFGLINKLHFELSDRNAELLIPQAISVSRDEPENPQSRSWTVIPEPVNDLLVHWRPRQRDRSEEAAVYFAEITTLLTPSSGLIEGFQDIAIRPAQGEIGNVQLQVPAGITINDVLVDDLSQWRFEPELGRLKIDLNQPKSQPFLIRIRSQWIAEALPYTATLALPTVENVSGQVGTIGIGTGNETQIRALTPTNLVPIDPQDFPRSLLLLCHQYFPDVRVRHAFRYGDTDASLELSVEAVAPQVTVNTQERLSIGEDRTLLATSILANVSRAGVFQLSFALPEAMNIDSVSGDRLSHWTEAAADDAKVITLHLREKHQGELRFDVTLSGPGIPLEETWTAPKISIREAHRQRGQLLVIPEQGIRLQLTTRENVSPIDPRKRGVNTNGAQAFDLLNGDWNLIFGVEQVAPWIEVASLQDCLFSEGKTDVTIFLDFLVKNTAVKSLSLTVPVTANNVRFEGQYIADSIRTPMPDDNRDHWTIRLQRRVIDHYRLVLRYQTALPEDDALLELRGAIVGDANLQRSFLALRTRGRLQVAIDQLPESLYVTDWHNIPRNLQRNLPDNLTVEHSFRAVSSDFRLPLTVSRRQITPTLTAQVNRFDLTTILSQNGSALTRADIELSPGSKRNLEISLPAEHRFWFARVNGQTVSALNLEGKLLIPLSPNLDTPDQTQVEISFQGPAAAATPHRLQTALRSLNLDLPADSVTWTVYLDRVWELHDWDGDLQLRRQSQITAHQTAKLKDYLSQEQARNRSREREAEQSLERGNRYLIEGQEDKALYNFEQAFMNTLQNTAINEDSRVQLENVKTSQALQAINVQQERQRGNLGVAAPQQQAATAGDALQDAELLDLAKRLVQQQDESTAAPRGFDVTFPEQGLRLEFLKSVQVDSLDQLALRLHARSAAQPKAWAPLAGVALFLAAVIFGRWFWRTGRPGAPRPAAK